MGLQVHCLLGILLLSVVNTENFSIPGEQGVAGMCGFHFPDDVIFSDPGNRSNEGNGVLKMAETILNHPEKVTIVATGAHTNVAMAIRLFPELKNKVDRIVFMGGAIGLGNTGVGAEFNIEIDPEAAHVVFHSGITVNSCLFVDVDNFH